MLYETAIESQRMDFNGGDTSETLQNITALVDLFDKHAHTEDNLVFPAVVQYEPAVVDAFEREHAKDHELSQRLRMLIRIFGTLETDEEITQLGSALRKAFVDFLVFNLEHMAKEEDIVNNVLWRYYTDEEIQGIEQNIVSSQTPETAALASKWMLRGLSNEEIIQWLRIVETNAPEHVFNNLFATAEKELPALRFRLILEGLTDGAMVA